MKPDGKFIFADGVPIDDIAVILACHEHASGLFVHDRMIGSPVAERKLIRVASECERDQLVPEADAERRIGRNDTPECIHIWKDRFRIAGPFERTIPSGFSFAMPSIS